jgi:hypothetical protein
LLVLGWHYCEASDGIDCRPCPDHAVCGRRDFNCQSGYERHDTFCIDTAAESQEHRAWKLQPVIEACLRRGRLETVGALMECIARAGEDAEYGPVEIGLAMTGEWAIVGNHIIRVPGEVERRRKMVSLAWISGILWVLLLYLVYRRFRDFGL